MADSAPHILVVDDLPANRLAMEAVLKPLGHPVVTASSGEEALRRILVEDFAVVLLDVNMPGMDGFETARFLRTLERTRSMPIVFVTARDENEGNLRRALTYGLTDFVYKPVSAEVLRGKMAIYLDLYEKTHRQRRVAEEQRLLAEAERDRFQDTFDLAPLGIGYLTPDGRWLGVNPRLCEMLGYSNDELLAKPLCELVSKADVEACSAALARLVTGERSVTLEIRLVRQDRWERWVQLTGSTSRKGTTPSYLIALFEDITERKESELQRDRSHREAEGQRRLLEAVLRQMPAGALVIEAGTGHLALANEQARTLLGRPLTSAGPGSLLEAGGLAGPLVRLLARSLREGEVVTGEIVTLEPGPGERRTLEVSTAPILADEGTPAAAVAILHDVTVLEEAKRELESSAILRERFVGIVSHDLRNPLGAALMSAHLLERLDLPQNGATLVARIQRACHTMQSLIVDLLDLTRARHGGGIPIRRERVDLAVICHRVADEVRAAHPNDHFEIRTSEIEVEADPERLAQALTNLVTNAVRYRREGTPIRVTLRREAQQASIEIHNEGEAIAPELLPHLFDAFRSGDSSSEKRRRTPGLGLGLYIAQQVILAHGGTIGVRSQAESGTTFSIDLPIPEAA